MPEASPGIAKKGQTRNKGEYKIRPYKGFRGKRRGEPRVRPVFSDSLLASVIVCTYNRSVLLKRLLESLTRQTAPPHTFEIIVVDDGSVDETPALCRSLMERMPNLKYIAMGQNSGLSTAANRAVSEARGQYLLFTDDDCIPHPQWVEKMCDALSGSPIVAGAVETPRSNYFKLCHNIAQFYPFMPGQKAEELDFIAGANMGIRADTFKETGAFNPRTVIPDMEFILEARRKGFTIAYAPDAPVTHDPRRVTFREVMSYAAAHAAVTILLRHRFRELLRTPAVLFSPTLILLASPVIAFRTTARIYLGNRKLLRFLHTAPIVYLIKLAWCWGAARGLRKNKRNTSSSPAAHESDHPQKEGIFLIGPSAPFRGGISHYNTLLFNHLSKSHKVLFYTFKKQYFKFLFPGKGDKDSSTDKIEPEGNGTGNGGSRLKRELHPLNLLSWIKAGREARNYRLILLPWWVVFWVPYYLLFLTAVKNKSNGNKVIFLCHNVEEHEQRKTGWLKRTLTRSVLKRGDGFILHSRGQERQLSRLLNEKNDRPAVVSPHPLYQVFNKDRYTFSTAREKLDIPPDRKTILFFGFIRKYKGLETLLRAMPAVREYDPRILLLIVGEVWGGKRQYAYYAGLIKELGLEENTLFVNRYVHNEEVEIYFKACDFVILPYTDGSGSGILQIAYGMGRPVAATRISAFEDVVEEGKTGCLVPPADEQQLAEAIIKMYESGLLPQMEKEITEYKKKFEWSMMTEQISRFYTSP